MPVHEINELCSRFIDSISPVRVYLFGSHVDGTANAQSDLDFYIVVKEDTQDLAEETAKAYRAIRHIKRRPVDIIAGTESRFEQRKDYPTAESEVSRKGLLLYG